MAFDKEELQQLETILDSRLEKALDRQRSDIMLDTRALLMPIKKDLVSLSERLDRLTEMVHENIDLALTEIES